MSRPGGNRPVLLATGMGGGFVSDQGQPPLALAEAGAA